MLPISQNFRIQEKEKHLGIIISFLNVLFTLLYYDKVGDVCVILFFSIYSIYAAFTHYYSIYAAFAHIKEDRSI